MRCGSRLWPIALLRRRLAPCEEDGFTLLELLVVAVIMAILIAFTILTYTGFRERTADASASANVRAALPSITAYHSDHDTYVGLSLPALATYDSGLSKTLRFSGLAATGYCVQDTVAGVSVHVNGPDTTIIGGAC